MVSVMMTFLGWLLFSFPLMSVICESRNHGGSVDPVLAICPGTCLAQEIECNSTVEGTHCGEDAKCCLDGNEHVVEDGFDFSTLPPNPEVWDTSDVEGTDLEAAELPDPAQNLGDFFLDSVPNQSFSMEDQPMLACPGACVPAKLANLCGYVIALANLCAEDKACCVSKEASMKFQEDFPLINPSVIITNPPAVEKCPGKCVHSSLTIFCDKVLSNYYCPTDSKCCNRQLTTTVVPETETIPCMGQCLPERYTYYCGPPSQLVPGTNCEQSTICCMKLDEPTSTEGNELGELATDENGQFYHVVNGEYKPLLPITPEESANAAYEYVADVGSEAGQSSIYRDSTGVLYQLSLLPREGLQAPMALAESTTEQEPEESMVEDAEAPTEKPLVSVPDDTDDMEENMKDVSLPDEGEPLSTEEQPIPPAERTMIRPSCPGSCISAFLKFTCGKTSATYDGFSCPGRLICCATLADINEHEEYLKSLSPYFKAAQLVNRPHPRCGIAGFERQAFGTPTAGKWCWQAAVINEQNQYTCGAAIVDNSWVLTPAHCVTGAIRQEQALYIRAGVTDLTSAADNAVGQTRKAQSIFVHPNHNSMSLDNDIAIIKLQNPFELTTNVCVVCLPTSGEATENSTCTVTGYGFLSRAGTLLLKLREARVPVVDDIDCIANVTDALSSVFILPSSSFCAGGHGNMESCQGDAGGPLVCENNGIYELMGMVSWSLGCKSADVPSIYVKIPAFMEWITQIISASTFLKALS